MLFRSPRPACGGRRAGRTGVRRRPLPPAARGRPPCPLTDQTVAPTIPDNLAQENTLDEGGQLSSEWSRWGVYAADRPGRRRWPRSTAEGDNTALHGWPSPSTTGPRKGSMSSATRRIVPAELEEVQTEMDDDRYAHSNPQVNSAAPTRQSVGQRQRLVRWIRVRCLGLHITESAGMGP